MVETTYKDIKIKAAMKLYYNPDPSMEAVRLLEEKPVRGGRHSAIKDARRYTKEFGLHLKLECPEPMCITDNGKEVNWKKVKGCIAKACQEDVRAKVKGEKWQGKMIFNRREDVHLNKEIALLGLVFGRRHPRIWLLVYKNFTNSYFQHRFLSLESGDKWQWRGKVSNV